MSQDIGSQYRRHRLNLHRQQKLPCLVTKGTAVRIAGQLLQDLPFCYPNFLTQPGTVLGTCLVRCHGLKPRWRTLLIDLL